MRLPPFQTLIDHHGRDVHRYLVACVGPIDADDCWQETMLAALRAYPGLRDDRNLRGWLLRIAARKVLDAHRATRRRPIPVEAVPERGVELPAPPYMMSLPAPPTIESLPLPPLIVLLPAPP